MKRLSCLLLLIMALVTGACSSIQSGQYVLLNNNIGPSELSKKYHVSERKIVDANKGRPFIRGQWIFIPQEKGILRAFQIDEEVPAQVDINSYGKKFLWPVPSAHAVSSNYGGRWGRKHEGIDIPAPQGTPFLAVDDGLVIYAGRGIRAYGNLTVLAHKDGFFSVYAHAKKNHTKKGQKVYRGQVLGQVGRTGRATGPHLHFELRKESRALNPIDLLARN
ncbi:MAG: M23 family metallopeptidase [Bdellovibrio sp.]|nr:M23 family metallopeptidase [Bdellovibrio sp.]